MCLIFLIFFVSSFLKRIEIYFCSSFFLLNNLHTNSLEIKKHKLFNKKASRKELIKLYDLEEF